MEGTPQENEHQIDKIYWVFNLLNDADLVF